MKKAKKKTSPRDLAKPIECWVPIREDGSFFVESWARAKKKPSITNWVRADAVDCVRIRVVLVKPKRKAAKK